jgi:hypothetical protein
MGSLPASQISYSPQENGPCFASVHQISPLKKLSSRPQSSSKISYWSATYSYSDLIIMIPCNFLYQWDYRQNLHMHHTMPYQSMCLKILPFLCIFICQLCISQLCHQEWSTNIFYHISRSFSQTPITK